MRPRRVPIPSPHVRAVSPTAPAAVKTRAQPRGSKTPRSAGRSLRKAGEEYRVTGYVPPHSVEGGLASFWLRDLAPGEWQGSCRVQRVVERGRESWTVIGIDQRPVKPVDRCLAWLTNIEKSPNTGPAYACDLKLFVAFLAGRDLASDRVSLEAPGEFTAWLRSPAGERDRARARHAGAGGERGEPDVERGVRLLRGPRLVIGSRRTYRRAGARTGPRP